MRAKVLPPPWFELQIPIYGGRLLVYKSRVQISKVVSALHAKEAPDGHDVTGVFFPATLGDGNTLYVVGWYDKKPSTLIHELLHATLYVLSSRGIDVTKDDESACYILQYMFGKINKED